jgi:hypothetical protein
MRTLKWLLVLAVPAVWVAAARPADQIVPEGTAVQLLLLRQKSVQEELKLTPEVVKKIVDFTNKEADAYLKTEKLTEEEGKKKIDELEKEEKKFLEDNLTAAQRKRLDQIALQVTGLQQLTRPEVAKVLNLTEDQQKKAKEMQEAARKEFEDILNDKNKEGRNQKLAKLREDNAKKIDALLTDAQKAKARELVGEPFKGELVIEDPEPEPKK